MSKKISKSKEEQQILLERVGDVFIITLTGSPHRANVFSIPLLRHLSQLLDEIEVEDEPCSLLFVGRGEKFFSAGFDLKALTGGDASQGRILVEYSWKILARLLVFPAPTFAVFNGHAFGLGLFLGLACDHRIMTTHSSLTSVDDSSRNKKGGKLCLPEITIGLPLGRGFAALAKCKMTQDALRTSALTGKQWSAHEALRAGIIDAIVPVPAEQTSIVPTEALEMAQRLVSTATKGNLPLIKMELYRETYNILMEGYANDVDTNIPSTNIPDTRSKL